MTTAIERLEKVLDEKDEEIGRFESKVEELEGKLRSAKLGWMVHTKLDGEQTLPVPRLELFYNPLGEREGHEWSRYEVVYRIVYRHFLGDIVSVPLGRTEISGGTGRIPMRNGKLEMPHRDGAHICNDMAHLKLPGFAVCGDHVDDLAELAGKPEKRW